MTEARATGTRKCQTPMNNKASMNPLISDQCPVRPKTKRRHRRVTTRWRLVTVKNLRSPKSLKSLIRSSFKAFRTVSQTLLAAYGAASSEIHTVVQKSLAKATAEDRTFVWGASGAIRCWLDSVKPAMAATEESTKDQVQLLAEAWQAGKDALDSILEYIPEEQEQEQEAHLTSVFTRATLLLAVALVVARRHTDEALQNIHAQLVALAKEHVPPEQVGALFNTILQVTCSFRQEMDNMATNQVFLPNQIVPNLWGSHRGLLEGLSLLGPPSCSASCPASLVEWVTAVPACQNISSSSKTPTKPNQPLSGVAKTTLDSRNKHLAKQATGLFWGDDAR